MKILIVSYYDFKAVSSGAINRVLGLARAVSTYASVQVLHCGTGNGVSGVKVRGYEPASPFSKLNWISIALRPYISYAFPDLYRAVKEAINEADIVQIEQPYLLSSALVVMKSLNTTLPIILDEHNVEFLSVKSKINGISSNSLLTITTLPYVFLSENFAVRNADAILTVSHEDLESLVRFYKIPRGKVTVIPNGVDTLKFDKSRPADISVLGNEKIVFFHGSLSWYPNLEAAELIVDYLAPKIPEAMFLIAGAGAPASFIRRASRSKNVKYLGFVKNIEGWIKASKLCIAPILRGGGTKLKILEYAAAGKPIVATLKAVQGLEMSNGVHGLFYTDVNEDFVNGIRCVLDNEYLAQELGQNAKELAKSYDWNLIAKKLYDLYSKLIE